MRSLEELEALPKTEYLLSAEAAVLLGHESAGPLANMRAKGTGPPYRQPGGKTGTVLYLIRHLREYRENRWKIRNTTGEE